MIWLVALVANVVQPRRCQQHLAVFGWNSAGTGEGSRPITFAINSLLYSDDPPSVEAFASHLILDWY